MEQKQMTAAQVASVLAQIGEGVREAVAELEREEACEQTHIRARSAEVRD